MESFTKYYCRIYLNFLALTISIFFLTACATHEDPRQGGLFGYNPDAYERRIAEREQRLDNIRGDIRNEDMRRSDLLEQEQRIKQREAALLEELRALDSEIALLEEQIKKDQTAIGSSKTELARQNRLRAAIIERRELVEEIQRLEEEALELEQIIGR